MLRSLVGSEMCIRDRYQRRVRDLFAVVMLRVLLRHSRIPLGAARHAHSAAAQPSAHFLRRSTLRVLPAFVRHASSTVVVPSMGESISEGTVVALLKAEGDVVEEDEVVVQIETDKVTVDVPSPGSGKIIKFTCAEDDEVEVGAELFEIEFGEVPKDSKPEATQAAAPTPAPEAPAASSPAPSADPKPQPPPPAAPAPPAPAADPSSRSQFKMPLSHIQIRSHQFLKDSQDTAALLTTCLLYTSDAADEEDSVDLGGRRIIKKKKKNIERSRNDNN
eukprot:TRINITY_DN7934_c0_g1_i2.p1 TRINITY_DN7934_c0_g1~~TRINITY_DN7934_c0_g1_i2.p1  ORF type:complete len:300 (+),score=86.23 TRINITY_DN7934_c0_g1_i2:73-900(+)